MAHDPPDPSRLRDIVQASADTRSPPFEAIATLSQDPLDPSRLRDIVHASADALSSPFEAIAALSHACMIATGFRFLGFGEDHWAGSSASHPSN